MKLKIQNHKIKVVALIILFSFSCTNKFEEINTNEFIFSEDTIFFVYKSKFIPCARGKSSEKLMVLV